MRKYILLFLFLAVYSLKAQDISSLYEYVLEDSYKHYIRESYLSNSDSVFYICGFCDCHNACYGGYTLNIENHKILNKMPEVGKDNPSSLVWVLSVPQTEGEFITISIGDYLVKYTDNKEDTNLILTGRTLYFFRYDKKTEKYVFTHKE